MNRSPDAQITAVFELPDFRRLLFAVASTTLASRALAVVVGYQVYAITKSPFALGYLGLVEAIPALGLALYGGHIADRYDRRSILRITLAALVICAAAIAGIAAVSTGGLSLAALTSWYSSPASRGGLPSRRFRRGKHRSFRQP
ncbi:MAG: hypothetical protein L0211_18640 [Planctomycetaceae bacterium]|nr:hypothetical protein [Planctomycetaceae bacterium]